MLASRVAHNVRQGFRALSAAAGSGQVACLDDVRSVVKVEGPTVLEFLQKIITNDATKLVPGAPPMYACVLTPQGRFLHDLFLHPVEGTDVPTVLVDCDALQRRSLMDLLQKYSLHHKVDVTSASKHYSVWASFGGSGGDASSPVSAAATAATQGWPEDPRLPVLGRRTILPRGSAPTTNSASWKEHKCWRIRHGVAEGDVEIVSGESVPLEYNLDKLNGISYTKGCYVGQEFVARVHSKGVIRKRLMPFRLGSGRGADAAVHVDPRSSHVFDVFDADESLQPIGKVRALQGEVGLAKLRLKQAMAAIKENKPLLVGDLETGTGYAEIWPWRPEWWEPSWAYEEMGEEDEQRKAA